jgi:hypothetical protein
MRTLTTMMNQLRAARWTLALVLATLCFGQAPVAEAETMLKAATTMIYGSSADTYSFTAPGAGTVTAQLSSLPWPVPLTALSFSATSATDTLSSWAAPTGPVSLVPHMETFEVGAGTYFAHVMATAGGSLNLGLYSILLTYTPSAVPLPTAAGLLLIGFLVLYALRGTLRGPRNESVMYPA